MIITTYKRKLPGGLLERNPTTGLVEIYTLIGQPPTSLGNDPSVTDIKTGTPEQVREPDPSETQVAAYKAAMPSNHDAPDPIAAMDAILAERNRNI